MASKQKTKGTPDAVDEHVGKRLRVRRSLLGLSQEKIAEQLGITFQQVQKYEKGTNRVSAGRLYQLSKILSVPVSFFFDEISRAKDLSSSVILSDNQQDTFDGEDPMQDKETITLVRAYYSIIDPDMRKDVLRHVKAIASLSSKK